MTEGDAARVLQKNGAIFKARKGAVDWYWSPVKRSWIAKQLDPNDLSQVLLREVPGSCNC